MPSVYADLFCGVDATDGAELPLSVYVQNDSADADGLLCVADIDGTAGAMAVPTSLVRQRVEMRVYVDGVLVPELSRVAVTKSRNQNLQQWEFSVPIHPGTTGYAGDFRGGGVGLCKKSVSIYGVYLTSTGLHLVPLIYDGIADNEGRGVSNGAFVTYQGVDRGGRFDRETVDLNLPPGHGLPRNRVIQLAAEGAGVTAFALDASQTNMMKEFVLADAPFIGPCQELAETEGRVIMWDRSGDMIWPRFGSYDLAPTVARWAFDESHFVRDTVSLSQPGELITEVTVDGDAQVIREQCGDVTVTQRITTKGLTGPLAPAWLQSSAGTFSANTQPAAPTDPVVERVEVIERVERCGILVYDRRMAYEFYNPEVCRYQWDAANDEWDPIDAVYTNDDTLGEDSAFERDADVWKLIEVDENWHYWYSLGYQGQGIPGLDFSSTAFTAPRGLTVAPVDGATTFGPHDGVKVGVLSRSWRWAAPRTYVKVRDTSTYPYDAWETVEPANATKVLGSKEAISVLGNVPVWVGASYGSDVAADGEGFLMVSQDATLYEMTASGYLTRELVHHFKYAARKGTKYWYGDDSERVDEMETMRYVGSTDTSYIARGEQSHDELVVETDIDGRTVKSELTTGLDSYLPAADRIPNSGPPADDQGAYTDSAEQTDLYRKAYRTESRPISVTVSAPNLENCSTRGVHRISSAWVENDDEAEWLGQFIIDEAASAEFRGDLAGANFFIEPGDWCSMIRARNIGVDSEGRVEEVTWSWSPGAPLNTPILVRLYGW